MYSKLIYVSAVALERPNIAPSPVTENLFHVHARLCEGGSEEHFSYVHVPPALQRAIEGAPIGAIQVMVMPCSELLRKLMPDRPDAMLTGVVALDGNPLTAFPGALERARNRRLSVGAALASAGAAMIAVGFAWLGAALCAAGVRVWTVAEALPHETPLKFNSRLARRGQSASS